MEQHATTAEPAPPVIEGEATEAPTLLLVMMWLPVFAVITWGMFLIFGRRPWDFSPDQGILPPPPPGEPLGDGEE